MREATFGRRNAVQPRRAASAAAAIRSPVEPVVESFVGPADDSAPTASDTADLSPEEELERWKAERRRERFTRIPWRQLWIMASACFGVAAFMLPDSVNDAVDWLLWGLMGASFAASFIQKRRAAAA